MGPQTFTRIVHLFVAFFATVSITLYAQAEIHAQSSQITSHGLPARLDIRQAAKHSIRITLKPASFAPDLPYTPALAEREYPDPAISLRKLDGAVTQQVGNLQVKVTSEPLTVTVTNAEGEPVQEVVFHKNSTVSFRLDESPVLGMGEGGPRPGDEVDWRILPVEFDRRGRFHNMFPRWQSNAYGSRNPVALMVGTGGWGLFFATPWGEIDLRDEERGIFIPRERTTLDNRPQHRSNQHENRGKGIPPLSSMYPGVIDLFVFDAHDPAGFMNDVSEISGKAVMPPKWTMGYMQSHRTLEDDGQLIEIVDTFREKKIPVDAVIYLGTGFTPRGWNTEQPSFEFNPDVFKREPREVISDLHDRDVKVIVHMIPWDRDKLPTLHGTIPPDPDETVDESHIKSYWQQHVDLVEAGIDAWWPDEGDWFNLFERIKRHQFYYQGPLSTEPDIRPWSLHRNGHLGIAKWGGWVWSGDTQSAWKTIEAQIAVGINHSLSLSPFWGSDIGGFYPNENYTGEMYARWFQFGAFCPSFRSHGRTWWTHLPWGWGHDERGPLETRTPPLKSELNNTDIEPVARKYAELRYRLLPYNYTLARQARDTGMPMMRAMWLHYPEDERARSLGDQYLWGRDMLIAPVYKKGATFRNVYLPEGDWYDWWTGARQSGGQTVARGVDLSIMPIYVRAGAIIPLDPVRQYTAQQVNEPTTLRIYSGADGSFTLYEDDGITLDYLEGESTWTGMTWDDSARTLTIEPNQPKNTKPAGTQDRTYRVKLLPEGVMKTVRYRGEAVEITF